MDGSDFPTLTYILYTYRKCVYNICMYILDCMVCVIDELEGETTNLDA